LKMSKALSHATLWYYMFACFLTGFVVRFVPEAIAYPAPIGYNVVAYYAPVLADFNSWGNAWFLSLFHPPQFSPLVYLLMIPLSPLLDPYHVLMIFAPTLNGILAVALYYYLNRSLGLSNRFSVLGSFFTVIQYPVLRLSLDMLSESLALSLGLFIVSLISTERLSMRKDMLLSSLLVAMCLAHQTVLLTLLPCVCYKVVTAHRKSNSGALALGVILLPAVALLAWNWSILQSVQAAFPAGRGVRVWFLWNNAASAGISPFANYLAIFDYPDLAARIIGFLLFLYLPLLPWVRRRVTSGLISTWALAALLLSVSPLVSPWFAFDLWYLWAIMLSVPLSVLAFEGLARIVGMLGKPRAREIKVLLVVLLLVPYVVVGAGYMTLPPERPFPIFTYSPFLSYMPSSMLSNTVPLQDSLDALWLLAEFNSTMDERSVLLTHEAFYGFTALSISGPKSIVNYHLGDPLSAVSYAKSLGFSKIYWIWWLPGYGWHGLTNPPVGFSIELHRGHIAIYLYKP
jgi:hypothetical protein